MLILYEAVAVVKKAVEICARGSVRLHKFLSNNVLTAIPNSEHADAIKDLDLQSNSVTLQVERALGVHCCLQNDEFKFTAKMKEQPLTRRGVLSNIASIFDPLGFLSPVVLVGKNILQSMCRNGAQWDEPLEPDVERQWSTCKDDLSQIHTIAVPRCIIPAHLGPLKVTELHHFSDASNVGIGQCSYLRVVDTHD